LPDAAALPRLPAHRPRKSPLQARSAATVDAIEEATVRILMQHGPRRLTTKHVAAVAGVSIGSLYQYFPNKHAILAEVIRRRAEALVDCAAAACEAARPPLDAAMASVVAAVIAEKRRSVAVSIALLGPALEVDARRIIQASARRLEESLAALLLRCTGRTPNRAMRFKIALAIAAVEGGIGAVLETAPHRMAEPELEGVLTRILLAALDEG
jgi:AcrR family transcriptional regulator